MGVDPIHVANLGLKSHSLACSLGVYDTYWLDRQTDGQTDGQTDR